MQEKIIELILSIDLGPDVEKEELDTFAKILSQELLEVEEIESIELLHGGELQKGTKGISSATGSLLIKLAESTGIATLINVFGSWLSRDKSRSLKLSIGENSIELTGLSETEQSELVDWFKIQAGLSLTG
jgi:hypothetical protein